MRLVVGAIALVLLVGCEPVSQPTTTTTDLVLPAPDPIETTTTTTLVESQIGVFGGVLPDDTSYVVSFDSPFADAVEGISAGIVIDVDGSPNAIGVARFNQGNTDIPTVFDDGIYRVRAGGMVTIEFYDHILEELGPRPEVAITTGIAGATRDDFPVLRLSDPFRWATDDELPLSMEVKYRHFVVRRGCGDLAAACSSAGTVQVIPIDTQEIPLEAWREIGVVVESPASR